MKIIINKSNLKGKINIQSSKSFSHRAIICAAITEGTHTIKNVNMCDDVKCTINALREIVDIQILNGNELIIKGGFDQYNKKYFQILESASTLRFLLPLLSFCSKDKIEINTTNKLINRVKHEYLTDFANCDIKFKNNKIISSGFCVDNKIKLSVDTTTQNVTGIIFLALKIAKNITIELNKNHDSIDYIDSTIEVANHFGYDIKRENNKILVRANQVYNNIDYVVPSDPIYKRFIDLVKTKHNNLYYDNIYLSNNDPDAYYLNNTSYSKPIDISNSPDLFMYEMVYSLLNEESVKFINFNKLIYKESNRIKSTIDTLIKMGANISLNDDCITVYKSKLSGGEFDSFNDHRIVFMLTLVSLLTDNEISVSNFEVVKKSNPNFFLDLENAGLDTKIVQFFDDFYVYNFDNNESKVVFSFDNVDFSLFNNKKIVLVVDNNLPSIHVEYVKSLFDSKKLLTYFTKYSGEKTKSIDEYQSLINYLIINNISKTDFIVSLGGGTVSDLVGFVSSSYKRGINYINIPTTLLSQVDASIGSKTALNFGEYKNVIGSFSTPKLTILSDRFLSTLNYQNKKSGMAELIKIASISDSSLFYEISDSENYSNLNEWIKRAVLLKINFVSKDPYDLKERHALNFGHTIGHVYELQNNISHGEAVAYGMSVESNNKFLKEILKKYDFKISENDSICNYDILNDKKIESGFVVLPVLVEIGKYKLKKIKL